LAKPAKIHTVASLLANAEEEGACLLWSGSLGFADTPQIYEKGRGMVSVRGLLSRLLGDNKPGAFYGVTCGNPHCIAPEHTAIRSLKEHARMMAKKANTGSGQTKRRAAVTVWRRANPLKLDAEKAAAIRADSRPSRQVAAEYGIDKSMVWKIKTGKAWVENTNPWAGLFAMNDSMRKAA
jgi:hypothetical protein